MALVLNGNGSIQGITAGGLPDGVITADDLAAGVGGKVLQVVQATKTDTASYTSATSSWTTLLSASITPSSTSSKILIYSNTAHGSDNNLTFALRIARGSTGIFVGDAASSRTQAFANKRMADYADIYSLENYSVQYLDSPSTTSSTTYNLQYIALAGGGTNYFNRTASDDDSDDRARTATNIILMEVAG